MSSIKKHAEVDSGADLSNIDMNQAVFTVPINFSGEARRDLRKSANEAGIEVPRLRNSVAAVPQSWCRRALREQERC